MIAEFVFWCSSVGVPLGAVPSCKGKRSYLTFEQTRMLRLYRLGRMTRRSSKKRICKSNARGLQTSASSWKEMKPRKFPWCEQPEEQA